jgi:cytoskeletal protein RodZ
LGVRGRQISEFEASLVYGVSSRTARAAHRNQSQKKKKKKRKKEKKKEKKRKKERKKRIVLVVKYSNTHSYFLSYMPFYLEVLMGF